MYINTLFQKGPQVPPEAGPLLHAELTPSCPHLFALELRHEGKINLSEAGGSSWPHNIASDPCRGASFATLRELFLEVTGLSAPKLSPRETGPPTGTSGPLGEMGGHTGLLESLRNQEISAGCPCPSLGLSAFPRVKGGPSSLKPGCRTED